jgi:dihydrofolate synthase / folylpolyglutamate synthase
LLSLYQMIVKPIKTVIFTEGQDLLSFLVKHLPKLKEEDVVVVTSKIVALAESRVVEIEDENTREKVIKAESQYMMRTKYTTLTIKDDMVMSAAGIDESNADGKIILLPKDSFKTAIKIRKALMTTFKLKKLGVLITDSRLLPLRAGIVGVALGYAGFKGLKHHRGRRDLYGREMKSSRTDVADSLAAISVLAQGEGDEGKPLAVLKNTGVEFVERIDKQELIIDVKDDRYQPLFEKIKKIRIKKGERHYNV